MIVGRRGCRRAPRTTAGRFIKRAARRSRRPGCLRAAWPRAARPPRVGGDQPPMRVSLGPGGLPLARPDRPVTLPIYPDNKAIASGLAARDGAAAVLQLDRVHQPGRRQGLREEVRRQGRRSAPSRRSTRRLRSSPAARSSSTCSCPRWCSWSSSSVGKLLQPLNLSYIPNLAANVWPSLHSPWYDVGSRYTVPYTVYTTGIGWRADKLPGFNPAKLRESVERAVDRGPEDLRQGRRCSTTSTTA